MLLKLRLPQSEFTATFILALEQSIECHISRVMPLELEPALPVEFTLVE